MNLSSPTAANGSHGQQAGPNPSPPLGMNTAGYMSSQPNITANPNYMLAGVGVEGGEATSSFYDAFRNHQLQQQQSVYEEHQILEDCRAKWHSTGERRVRFPGLNKVWTRK